MIEFSRSITMGSLGCPGTFTFYSKPFFGSSCKHRKKPKEAHTSRNGSLDRLTHSDNSIGDGGMQAFASAVSNGSLASLRILGLSRNLIGDAGVTALAGATASGSMAKLEVLRLNNNQIGEAGLQAFAGAIGNGSMGQLIHLRLSYNLIGDAGMTEFSRAIAIGALPACKAIVVYGNPGNVAPLKAAACEERGTDCVAD